jgi:hypothetical protein
MQKGQGLVEYVVIIFLVVFVVVAALSAIDFKQDLDRERWGGCDTFGYEIVFVTRNRRCARWLEADLDKGMLYWDNGSASIATVRSVHSTSGYMCNRGGIRSGNCAIVTYRGGN